MVNVVCTAAPAIARSNGVLNGLVDDSNNYQGSQTLLGSASAGRSGDNLARASGREAFL
jgi:hypothetical protein